jgi:hypothetical protein
MRVADDRGLWRVLWTQQCFFCLYEAWEVFYLAKDASDSPEVLRSLQLAKWLTAC